ncbi:MAG: FkbM family methyltransferase [Alphaproteobacteria bacterium]|nr:FkbM family methyltransferase [Alphaproteobacteria bacterium]
MLTTTLRGQKLFLDSRDLSLSPHIILEGTWEPSVTRAIASLVKPGMTVVEIGANVGYYTTLFGALVGPGGCVRAFEANPEIFELLTHNIDINGLIPFVKAEPMLVCDSCGEREITLLDRHRGSGSMLSFTDEFVAMFHDVKTTISVRATTLDEYWKGVGRPIDLIKVDAEGSEPMIVDGMQAVLGQPHLTLVCEFAVAFYRGSGGSAERFLNTLLAHGFSLNAITKNGIVPVSPEELLSDEAGVELLCTK